MQCEIEIHGLSGEGKTEILRKIEQLLEQEGFTTYFNYLDYPLSYQDKIKLYSDEEIIALLSSKESLLAIKHD